MLFRVLRGKVFFKFLSDRIFFRFFSDRVFLMVLRDRFLYWVHNPFFSVCHLFCQEEPASIFFKIKNRCSVFHDIFKKTFTLINKFSVFYTFNKTDSEKYEEMYDMNTKCYAENIGHIFPIYK